MRTVQLVFEILTTDIAQDFSVIEFDHQQWQRQSVALRRGESKEYEVVGYVKRTLLADFVSAVSEPNFPSWNENLLPCMHSFWKFPRTANNDCAHLLGIYRNSIGSWKVTGVLRIIKYNARHRLNLLHHRWSVDAYFLYFVIVFHTCARVNGLIYFKILFLFWSGTT